ncbi:ABC transporter permease [Streptomyces agglomeratus]|uniref:ABC transporter permease n=1 Tax=Streptomyces agglomeratus TaxID=285458 RepID=A0A1E5P4D7_9ACTN|nr:branched-chain amino acid ABC transporter permease [Streptomyces agglomeratus]OEJ24406.1 ABC transporter permease [Streptomyces agglomeratus]OEJ41642.1 ABC transporter permease [Streptomyces agglomeratus]OEJ43979.1 ABC transporter permease [Streptomyces agglomeratus]OEJ54133.1 ABC transporter permease [Streptomyces agglomeratus]OEJ61505.1 ABC transporter permease [Streptomyces agglomeratus]
MAQLIWDGLFVGAFYSLIALGYSLVYGVIRLLNFAHGDLYMLGAFFGLWLLTALGAFPATLPVLALLVVLVVVSLATGLAGVAIERVAYRPLRQAPRLSLLITAVGASFVVEYGVRIAAGPNPQVYPLRLDGEALTLFGARFTPQQLLLMGVAIALMLGLDAWINRSRDGRAIRAVALDQKAARLMGIDVDKVISRVFFVGSALAGAAGVMVGVFYGKVDFLMGFIIGLKAFTAAVIGGIGNLKGTMLGGLVLGLLESFGSYWLGGEWRDVFAFGFLILLLSVRPTGLLGAREQERV